MIVFNFRVNSSSKACFFYKSTWGIVIQYQHNLWNSFVGYENKRKQNSIHLECTHFRKYFLHFPSCGDYTDFYGCVFFEMPYRIVCLERVILLRRFWWRACKCTWQKRSCFKTITLPFFWMNEYQQNRRRKRISQGSCLKAFPVTNNKSLKAI